MKKILLIWSLIISWNAFGQDYESNRPIWDQYKVLFCSTNKDIDCKGDSCKTNFITSRSFELNFQKDEINYLGQIDLQLKILSKFFHKKDQMYKRERNNILSEGFTMELFNFKDVAKFNKPEFVLVETQILNFPESESQIRTLTTYSKCYPK